MNERIAGAIGKIEFAQSITPNFTSAAIGAHLGGRDLTVQNDGPQNTPAPSAPKNDMPSM